MSDNTIENISNVKIDKTYLAFCPMHDWEGFRRDNYSDAEKDLEGHLELFPDESHSGSGVKEE